MKTIIIITILLCFGCVSAPESPNSRYIVDAIMNHGMKADQVNQIYDDYGKAKAEYENSASYKLKILAVAPLLVLGAAAADVPYYGGYYSSRGYGYLPGKTIVTTNPIGGGAYRSVIKHYK